MKNILIAVTFIVSATAAAVFSERALRHVMPASVAQIAVFLACGVVTKFAVDFAGDRGWLP